MSTDKYQPIRSVYLPGSREPSWTAADEACVGGLQLQTRSSVHTGLVSTCSRLLQSITLELDVGEPLQLGHLTVSVDVEGDGHVVQPDVIHATNKASLNTSNTVTTSSIRHSRHLGTEEHVALVQVEDVIESRSSTMSSPLSIH